MEVRLGELKLTNLADQRPRSGWSMPRIVENSDPFLFHIVSKKVRIIDKKNNKYLVACMF
jgi:hypothetical protein